MSFFTVSSLCLDIIAKTMSESLTCLYNLSKAGISILQGAHQCSQKLIKTTLFLKIERSILLSLRKSLNPKLKTTGEDFPGAFKTGDLAPMSVTLPVNSHPQTNNPMIAVQRPEMNPKKNFMMISLISNGHINAICNGTCQTYPFYDLVQQHT